MLEFVEQICEEINLNIWPWKWEASVTSTVPTLFTLILKQNMFISMSFLIRIKTYLAQKKIVPFFLCIMQYFNINWNILTNWLQAWNSSLRKGNSVRIHCKNVTPPHTHTPPPPHPQFHNHNCKLNRHLNNTYLFIIHIFQSCKHYSLES